MPQMGLILFFLLLSLIMAFIKLVASMSNVTPQDIAWISADKSTTPATAGVYRRYLSRHRRHRLVGGTFGVLFATIVGVRLYQSVNIGNSTGNPLADIWFCGLAGVIIGALSAETFRLSEPSTEREAASLAERGVETDNRLLIAARTITVIALVASIPIAITAASFDAVSIAVFGLALALLAEATRRAITDRRRPLQSPVAKTVDIQIRSFALTMVAFLQLSASLLVASWVASKIPASELLAVQVVQGIFSWGALIASTVTLRKAKPHAPKNWSLEQVAA